MFKKLSMRIILISFFSIWSCTLVLSISTYNWAKKSVTAEYINVAQNYFKSSNDNLKQYLNFTEGTLKMIANSPSILVNLNKYTYVFGFSKVLNNLVRDINPDIQGAAIYRPNGDVYYMDRMSEMPDLNRIQENPLIHEWMFKQDALGLWLARFQNIPLYYSNNNSGDILDCVLTNLLKIYDSSKPSHHLLGYFITDLDIGKLFEFYTTQNRLFQKSDLALIIDQKKTIYRNKNPLFYMLQPRDLQKINNQPNGWFMVDNGKYVLLFDTVINSKIQVVLMIPVMNALNQIQSLKWTIISLCIIMAILSIVVAIKLRDNLIKPLRGLYKKIQKFG